MKKLIYLTTVLLAVTILGCRTADPKAASAIEGSYVRVDKPNITLIIQEGHYKQGAADIHAEGTYTAYKIAENKYKLNVAYHEQLEGAKGTVIVRKEGDFVYTQEDGEGPETKFKKQ
ncbi:MAG: hypothetical protein JWR19_348 [Pedosphaera sp.]|nr:hypothetical protein [Pedosphaera sp.]